MKLAEFHYDLPPEAIAQEPVEPRDRSKLMLLSRGSDSLSHKHFYDLPDLLRAGDVLVLNATRVFPARLKGKKSSGGKVELLLISPYEAGWKALVRGSLKETELEFPEGLRARMTKRLSEGEWLVEFSRNHLRDYLGRYGEMPLPPYIKRPTPRQADVERYQTVYAQEEGAVAAPTAGFHFTAALLDRLRAKGVEIQSIVLHVGWGTFRPIRTESIEAHAMLPETYHVTSETAQALNRARVEKRRVIAVGTTAVRTLESVCDDTGRFAAAQGESNLFIYPGYRYRAIDALITNFHLPDSTPLLLACAFYGQGKNVFSLQRPYQEAITHGYRFYSYGDAMFIQ